jgi:DNA-nicking Smr family endonuclease
MQLTTMLRSKAEHALAAMVKRTEGEALRCVDIFFGARAIAARECYAALANFDNQRYAAKNF